ncbi:Tubby-like F-box protein 8 [Cucumis melo var. makuwa]|uniref:Tubby-like F-box protein 8 n=1 Tax=Cucumis melo var. makuwa TaxID=1194695 RepID=A0A5A7T6K1_CUCMM|nr:Tubby-like F-box protein 8 [Cucumis melo var. makuwa]
MEKSAAAAAAILCLLLLSAEAVVTVSADAADCIDACFTACVQKDSIQGSIFLQQFVIDLKSN